jgi:hypothetical protein
MSGVAAMAVQTALVQISLHEYPLHCRDDDQRVSFRDRWGFVVLGLPVVSATVALINEDRLRWHLAKIEVQLHHV